MIPGILYSDADLSQTWFSFYLGAYLHLNFWWYSDTWRYHVYNCPNQEFLDHWVIIEQ